MSDRRVFHDSVVPLPVQTGLTPNGLMVQQVDDSHRDEPMMVHFSLALPAEAEADLEDKVARGETIAPESIHQEYGASKSDADSLVRWLKDNGYTIDDVSPDHASVYATAPITKIEQTLDVNMVRVTQGGLTYTAARNAPSLPADIGVTVQGISGLQPFLQVHKHSKRTSPKLGNRSGVGMTEGTKVSPAPNIANAPPYLASEILQAYNGNGLTVDGAGQTIAILIDTFPADSDLTMFWSRNQQPTTLAQIEKINVGGLLPAPEGEETLDVQWSSGIAPRAKIRIYATGSLSFVAIDRALDRILADVPSQPGMRQLSISLGLGETYLNGPGGEVAIEHQKFLKLAAAGVNVFVSTGDAGSNPDQTGHISSGPRQVEYESSDPCVIAVGGTSLRLAPNGTVASEVGWSGGGGGKSIYFTHPAWQTGPGISGSRRLVPDVSVAADPDEGAFLVLNGTVHQIGGTSWSAPVWAGICALINSSRAGHGKPPLAFLNPQLYPLRSQCFRDVVSGSNGAYHAQNGYDLVTGLGVPNIRALVQHLG